VTLSKAFLLFVIAPALASAQYTISVFAGTGRTTFAGDGGPATAADLSAPSYVAADNAGNVYIADTGNGRIRKVDSTGTITTVAGGGTRSPGTGVPATSAGIGPSVVALDNSGLLYFARPTAYRIDSSGLLSYIPNTEINFAGGMAFDSSNNLFISDFSGNTVIKVTPTGNITSVAGTGSGGYSGDNGPAISAQIVEPSGIAVDSQGNVYIADSGNNRVRKVNPGGTITTIAGNGQYGYLGDGGPATNASFKGPSSVAVDSAGNVFVSDYNNCVLRRIDPSGIVATIAGTGQCGDAGDGGPAASASISRPYGVAVDSSGRIYIVEGDTNRVRVLTPLLSRPAQVTSLNPVSAVSGSSDFSLNVSGNSFVAGAVVQWN
jgi:sugar lactone lactonase YvrE